MPEGSHQQGMALIQLKFAQSSWAMSLVFKDVTSIIYSQQKKKLKSCCHREEKARHGICEVLTGVCRESIASWFNIVVTGCMCTVIYTEHGEQFKKFSRVVLNPCDFHHRQ